MGYFFFFTQTGLFTTLLHFPMHKKNFTKNILNFYLLKAKNFHGDSCLGLILSLNTISVGFRLPSF